MSRLDQEWLADIIDAIQAIQRVPAARRAQRRTGLRRRSSSGDRDREAVKRLNPELLASEPDLPWEEIAGMRDRLAHRGSSALARSSRTATWNSSIGGVGDASEANRLTAAIDGGGAFRRFRDALDDWPEELDRWHAISEDRQRGRGARMACGARILRKSRAPVLRPSITNDHLPHCRRTRLPRRTRPLTRRRGPEATLHDCVLPTRREDPSPSLKTVLWCALGLDGCLLPTKGSHWVRSAAARRLR